MRDHLVSGSKEEDSLRQGYNARAMNHFHDPTLPFHSAGLEDGLSGQSAAVWAGNWYDNERDLPAFYDFLELAFTSPTAEERELYLAETMKTAGHLVHLLQDMAVPAHTRNDLLPGHLKHIAGTILVKPSSPFESYVAEHSDLLDGIQLPEVPVFEKFEDYFDTEQYRSGGFVPVSGTSHGLSEYSHSNFFSELQFFYNGHMLSGRPYVNPSVSATESFNLRLDTKLLYPHLGDKIPAFFYARYLGKSSLVPAQDIDFLGREGFFGKYLGFTIDTTTVFLDKRCWEEYFSKLGPQALAYSAGLLEYLFRGDMDFQIDTGSGTLAIANNGTRDMQGLFTLHYDNNEGLRSTQPGWEWFLSIPAGQIVTVPSEVSVPRDAGLETSFAVTFRGTLGESVGVVTGAAKKLSDYDFSVVQDVTYGEIQYPKVFDVMSSVDDTTGDRTRTYWCSVDFVDSLSTSTAWRSTDLYLYIAATPELAKKLGYRYREGGEYAIDTNSFNYPDLVEHFILETAPGVFTYVYDREGIHEDSGWDGVSRPLKHYEGAWQAGSQYVSAYRSLGSLLNMISECSPNYYQNRPPDVYLALRYSHPDGAPYCADAESIIQEGAGLCDDYRVFYNYSLSVAGQHRQLMYDNNWQTYGYRIRLNRLKVASPKKGDGVIFDGPVTFTKGFGEAELVIQ